MAIEKLHVSGYRSVRDLTLKLGQLNVIVGPNGCGKSNLYRALYLVAAAAGGTLARDLAHEGGLPSALWSGQRHKKEDHVIELNVGFDDDLSYELELGRVPSSGRNNGLGAFVNDPHINKERVSMRTDTGKDVVLVHRHPGHLTARNMDGRKIDMPLTVMESESVLSGLREPHKFPELSLLRQRCMSWRFYHKFRTDLDSPIRQPQAGTVTPVLSHDGNDLAAALATITAIGNTKYLHESIARAFPGSQLKIGCTDGTFRIEMTTEKQKRPFNALELSDGTLHYLCLLGALLSPRPAPLIALNEPETSIHPDLFRPLAELISYASKYSQIWLTTHSRDLASYIGKLEPNARTTQLEKRQGATAVVGRRPSQIENDESLSSSEADD